ncbi:MAG: Lrp/AsnC family transcriptional regulator [Candidatus Altiarchaeales archaeon]|nr:Lrp/AsnC family transcriptional regulator [Candidatus Altiarchaeales archaeon]
MKDDSKLLELLEEDGRASAKELASMLGLKEKEVDEKIKDLKKKSVIRGFKAVVDWRKASVKKVMAVIQVKVIPQAKDGFAKVCLDLSKDRRVLDAFVATGEYDLLLFVEANTLEEISDFVTERLATRKEVTGTNTHIILSQFKRDGKLFADAAAGRLPLSP